MRDERGSATVLSCFAMLALVAVVAAVGYLGSALVTRHRAQAVADLGALAAAGVADLGVDGACTAAGEVAGRSRATVLECRLEGWDAVVRVAVPVPLSLGYTEATAAARAGPAADRGVATGTGTSRTGADSARSRSPAR
ncbi:Rv3654c family TadE-like protein [Rhodococcus sp. NPDC003348]